MGTRQQNGQIKARIYTLVYITKRIFCHPILLYPFIGLFVSIRANNNAFW